MHYALLFAFGFTALLARAGSTGAQEVGKDVPPTHWAYAAVQDLAGKGLLKGYPPDANFLGGRTLTRYEMATLIQRVVARMDDLLNGKGSQEDLAKLNRSAGEIRELVNGFKTELTVIGTDMEKVKSDLAALKAQVDTLSGQVGDLTRRVDETNIAVDQALENIVELKNATNAALAKKVEVGAGKLRIGGLLQAWYGTAFGDTFGGNFPLNTSAVPPGRNFGGGVGDTFRLRRGEISFYSSLTPKVDYKAMLDIAKTGTGAASVLQDLWIAYQFTPRLRLEFGQQKPNLTEEGPRSSAQQLTVERSIMNSLPPTVGRVGDMRDTGVILRYQSGVGNLGLGIWNDDGATQNVVDTDRQKFLSFSAFFTGIRHLTLGVWGGTNLGDSQPAAARDRLGGTLLWQSGPHYFEVEGAYTRDYVAGGFIPAAGATPALGGTIGLHSYALYAHTLSPQWQLVGRYDYSDPAYQGGNFAGSAITATGVVIPRSNHRLREYTLGFTYYILKQNAKIQVNYIREDVEQNGVVFFGKQRTLLLTNYQVSF
jgi:archaellum component FlaC